MIRISEEKQALRQRRLDKLHKPFVIGVIGIDGSGKSTLSRRLVHFFEEECCFIGDDLEFFMNGKLCDTQPLMTNELRKWVGKKAKKAKNLAFYKIPKLTELILRDRLLLEVERWYRPRYIFLDGAPLLNMVGWAILYREDFFNQEACAKAIDILTGKVQPTRKEPIFKQYPELFALCEFRLNHLKLPDVTILLDVSPEVCVQRIESRGEAIQPHENIPKLSKLREAYKLVCKVLAKEYAVYVVSGDRPLDLLARESAEFIKEEMGRRNGTN